MQPENPYRTPSADLRESEATSRWRSIAAVSLGWITTVGIHGGLLNALVTVYPELDRSIHEKPFPFDSPWTPEWLLLLFASSGAGGGLIAGLIGRSRHVLHATAVAALLAPTLILGVVASVAALERPSIDSLKGLPAGVSLLFGLTLLGGRLARWLDRAKR